jgi:hypothetical protein
MTVMTFVSWMLRHRRTVAFGGGLACAATATAVQHIPPQWPWSALAAGLVALLAAAAYLTGGIHAIADTGRRS